MKIIIISLFLTIVCLLVFVVLICCLLLEKETERGDLAKKVLELERPAPPKDISVVAEQETWDKIIELYRARYPKNQILLDGERTGYDDDLIGYRLRIFVGRKQGPLSDSLDRINGR